MDGKEGDCCECCRERGISMPVYVLECDFFGE